MKGEKEGGEKKGGRKEGKKRKEGWREMEARREGCEPEERLEWSSKLPQGPRTHISSQRQGCK